MLRQKRCHSEAASAACHLNKHRWHCWYFYVRA